MWLLSNAQVHCHNLTSFQDPYDSWMMRYISVPWEDVTIEKCTGPLSKCDVISRFLWFMNDEVHISTMRRCDYWAMHRSTVIMWRHIKIPMIYESQGGFNETVRNYAYRVNALVRPHNATSFQHSYDSWIRMCGNLILELWATTFIEQCLGSFSSSELYQDFIVLNCREELVLRTLRQFKRAVRNH